MSYSNSILKALVVVLPSIPFVGCGPTPQMFQGDWSSDGNGQITWSYNGQTEVDQLGSPTYTVSSGDTDSQLLISDVISAGVCNATADIEGNELSVKPSDPCPATVAGYTSQVKYTSGTFRLESDVTRASWTSSGTLQVTGSSGPATLTFKIHDTLTKNQ